MNASAQRESNRGLLSMGPSAGGLASAVFLALAVFQVALALGAPFGRAAWGGAHETLPAGLRFASAAAAGIYILSALIVLRRTGSKVVPISPAVARVGAWLLTAAFAFSALFNFVSQSNWERLLWGPVALALSLLCFLVARSKQPDSQR